MTLKDVFNGSQIASIEKIRVNQTFLSLTNLIEKSINIYDIK